MRFIIVIVTTAVFSFISGIYYPWWMIAVISFAVSLLLPQKPAVAFIAGFLSIFLLWIILAASINASNNGILAGRVGQLFKIGSNPAILIFITGLIGGLISGFAALSASYIVYLHKKQR